MAKILVFEPYYGGSHRAFIDGWVEHSKHRFTLLTLPAHHWKWRMRHAATTLVRQACSSPGLLADSDVIWSSSMLNVAELRGLLASTGIVCPTVCYFHENQLEYPIAHPDPRDVHFAFDNWISARAADEVWFNSRYNRDTLLEGLAALFRKMPDQRSVFQASEILERSVIEAPGIWPNDNAPPRREQGPLALAWAARWEHDKGPDLLHDALVELERRGVDYTIAILGERFKSVPPAFESLKRKLGHRIVQFGWLESYADYQRLLGQSDVFISTAQHEFFGIAVMEGVAAGCRPLLPRSLVYPELFGDAPVFHDGTPTGLANALAELASGGTATWPDLRHIAESHTWPNRAESMDARIDALVDAAPVDAAG